MKKFEPTDVTQLFKLASLKCGCYILWGDDPRPLYVGQSRRLILKRFIEHHERGRFPKNKLAAVKRAFFFPCHDSKVDLLEKALIWHYQPTVNRASHIFIGGGWPPIYKMAEILTQFGIEHSILMPPKPIELENLIELL